jgi:16S rRNA (guanine527-N7)-methyltransferase
MDTQVFQQEFSYLRSYVDEQNIPVTDDQIEKLLRHLELVIEKNKVMNLTRIVDVHEATIKHIIDSILLLKCEGFAREDPTISFVDIGTGAGFPGIPIGICTSWNGLLVDSVQKKIKAVEEFTSALDLTNLQSSSDRIEVVGKDHHESHSVVVARAVADMSTILEYASPLLKKSGLLYIMKATPTDEELHHARQVESLCGFTIVSRETFTLPEAMGHRTIHIYKKTHSSKIKLPRKIGEAKKTPLYQKSITQ